MVVPGQPISGHKMALSRAGGGTDGAHEAVPSDDGAQPDGDAFMAAYAASDNGKSETNLSSPEPESSVDEAGATPGASDATSTVGEGKDDFVIGFVPDLSKGRDGGLAPGLSEPRLRSRDFAQVRAAQTPDGDAKKEGRVINDGSTAKPLAAPARSAVSDTMPPTMSGAPPTAESSAKAAVGDPQTGGPQGRASELLPDQSMASTRRPMMSDANGETTRSKDAGPDSARGTTAHPAAEDAVHASASQKAGSEELSRKPNGISAVAEDPAPSPLGPGKTPGEAAARLPLPAPAEAAVTSSRIAIDTEQSRAIVPHQTEPTMTQASDRAVEPGAPPTRTAPAAAVTDAALQNAMAADRPLAGPALAGLQAVTGEAPTRRFIEERFADLEPRIASDDRSRPIDTHFVSRVTASQTPSENRSLSSFNPTSAANLGVSDFQGFASLESSANSLGNSASVTGLSTSASGQAAVPFFQGGAASTAQTVAAQIVASIPRPMSETGNGTLEIALDPPELGRVRLSLVEIAGAMTLSISAERPETAELMRRHLDLLSQEFTRSGLDASNVRIGGENGGSTGRGPGHEAATSGKADGGSSLPNADTDTVQPTRTDPGRDSLRALDLRL